MKVIFLGKHSPPSSGYCKGIDALEYLLEAGCNVVCVVSSNKHLSDFAKQKQLMVKEIDDLYEEISHGSFSDIDFIISYGYMKLIKEPLVNLSSIGCINFHPAPLPEWQGMGGVFNFALFEEVTQWGVTAHLVDNSFDTGDILKIRYFNIDPSKELVSSLIKKSHHHLLSLFYEVIDMILSSPNKISPRKQGPGRYISKKDFNELRKIKTEDSLEIIDKKIKAFFYPPRHGAFIEIKGKEYTLLNSEMLKKIKLLMV
jgi:methionyl-tRNA formyltransferase